MPDAETFWDKTASKYAKSPIKNIEAYNQTMDRTRAYLAETDNVLEVGCGTGSTALLLAGDVGQITASDISSRMIEIAEGKARDQQIDNVCFIQATLTDGALKDGPYDVVLAFNFLHLLEDLPGAVRAVRELLKPQGLFISKTVCLAEQSRLWRIVIYVMNKLGLAPYVNVIKISELEDLLTAENFEIVETGLYPAPRSGFIVARKI